MRVRRTTWIVLGIAIVLIVVGVMKNQPADVMTKAVKICLECVGIG